MTFCILLFADEPAACAGATIPLYGVSMLERHLRTFASLGAESVTVIGPSDAGQEAIRETLRHVDARWFPELKVEFHPSNNPEPWGVSSPGLWLLADAHHLYDPRLLKAVLDAGPNTHLTGPQTGQSGHLALVESETLNLLTRSWTGSAALWRKMEEMPALHRLNIQTINPYMVNLRRSIPPYWLPVTSVDDARAGEARLIDAAQKGALDWPAQYVHPPFENLLIRLISKTAITPNQVTAFTNVIAFLATGLLASGALIAGFLIAAIVGIFDGVDGKLARVTVRCSRIGGQAEHTLDIVYEVSWYWALGWVLSQNGAHGAWPLMLSGIVTVFYFLGRGATGLFKMHRGVELFDYTPLDRAFRRISGRRNIYVALLLPGAVCQLPLPAFEAVAVWAIVTAVFHWVRALWLWRQLPENAHAAMYSGEAAS